MSLTLFGWSNKRADAVESTLINTRSSHAANTQLKRSTNKNAALLRITHPTFCRVQNTAIVQLKAQPIRAQLQRITHRPPH